MASCITQIEFQDALSRYTSVIKKISRKPKEGSLSLEELDEFRYQTASTNFSQNTGNTMEISDVMRLIEWKIEELAVATKNAFEYYAEHKDDIAGTLDRLAKPLRGIGPAAGSLILSIHDPQNIVYFSDELFRWLCTDSRKVSLGYTVQEYERLYANAKTFMARIQCTPIELEKVAYVFIREHDSNPKESSRSTRGRPALPDSEKKFKKPPSGRPRGRPALPDSEKKPKKPPSGRPRGRPALPDSEKKSRKPPSGRPRGRPALPDSEKKPKKEPSGRPRGRPAGVVTKWVIEETPGCELKKEATVNRGISINASTTDMNGDKQDISAGKRKASDIAEGSNKMAKHLIHMSISC